MIGWSQDHLAEASKVAKATIANFEAGKRAPYARTLDDLRTALEAADVIFVDENGEGPGVRLRKTERPAANQTVNVQFVAPDGSITGSTSFEIDQTKPKKR